MTPVIFRKWQNDVISLFPTIAADMSGHCQSYQHIGQHGATDYLGIVERSKLAIQSEYADLFAELIRIGYDDLKVYQRKPNGVHVL